ncbi:Uncharacterised protein [Mycobacteroides abscessus subsp. abscessus]|nr:Uncharacterised protein [Mycobacteroides abscessus subsp. abscessus]
MGLAIVDSAGERSGAGANHSDMPTARPARRLSTGPSSPESMGNSSSSSSLQCSSVADRNAARPTMNSGLPTAVASNCSRSVVSASSSAKRVFATVRPASEIPRDHGCTTIASTVSCTASRPRNRVKLPLSMPFSGDSAASNNVRMATCHEIAGCREFRSGQTRHRDRPPLTLLRMFSATATQGTEFVFPYPVGDHGIIPAMLSGVPAGSDSVVDHFLP